MGKSAAQASAQSGSAAAAEKPKGQSFLDSLVTDAQIIERMQGTPDKMRAKIIAWVKKVGENMDHSDLAAASEKKAAVVKACYHYASYIAKKLGKVKEENGIPKNAGTLSLLGRACHFAAKHVQPGATIKKDGGPVSLAEEIGGIVQTQDNKDDLNKYPTAALLDMAATLRHVCTKLPDLDLGDVLGIDTWFEIMKVLHNRTQIIQVDPWNYPPKRALAEIREMKKYLRGRPDDPPVEDAELDKLHPTRRDILTQRLFPLENSVMNSPNIAVGIAITVAFWCGKVPQLRTRT